jgi:hypothetical protein
MREKFHFIFFACFLFPALNSFSAWVVTYTMTPSQPGYTAITGTAGATVISNFGFCPDQTVSQVIPIGFNFTFDGTVYTSFVATDNGIIMFGNLSPLSGCGSNAGTSSDIPNNLADGSIPRPFLAPLWEELQFKPTSPFGSGSYKTTGVAGSRSCTMEWNKMSWRAPSNGDQISFQIVLYEGSNIIDFNYSQGADALGTFPTASIGLGAIASGTYYSLNNSTNSAVASSTANNSSIAAKPTTGQRFRWSPVGGLPIELISFTGERLGNENLLRWNTASQINNDFFTIEHSPDCETFTQIAKVDGAGNYNYQLSYEAADPEPFSGTTYYRLNWTDFNNVTEHSGIISIIGDARGSPTFFPNPVIDLLYLSDLNKDISYAIMNSDGQLISEGTVLKGDPQIDLSDLNEGLYFLVFDRKTFHKVLVKR